MKHLITVKPLFYVLFSICIVSHCFTAKADKKAVRERRIVGNIVNATTGQHIQDTIFVELLTPDSIVVGKAYSKYDTRTDARNRYWFELYFKDPGNKFILRFSNPEYKTVYKPVSLKLDRETDLQYVYMRKLTRFEKVTTLQEAVVTPSVIQVVNKGDTIQYNADAFALAQGSMLDALIEQLPGVELRENGQIFVNGRYVDKILLDGKDFFNGDQFVLLQNLPAYTVKNLKVYEKGSLASELLDDPKKTSEQKLYVMDVNLKKEYNHGIIANAEAGVGTHSRYRGRAFGVMFGKTFRIGAFAFINNLNEKRRPGSNGNWSLAESKSGISSSKGGGVDYSYTSPDNMVEFNGDLTAQYDRQTDNSLTNIENFLSVGNTFTRRWQDILNRNLDLKTENKLSLRTKSNQFNQNLSLNVKYGTVKDKTKATEGTFGKDPGNAEGLRDILDSGWADGMSEINRFLQEIQSGRKKMEIEYWHGLNFKLPGIFSSGLFRPFIFGSYDRTWLNGQDVNNYLLQYAGKNPQEKLRSNPLTSHHYFYNIIFQWNGTLADDLYFDPRIEFIKDYEHKNNHWFTNDASGTNKGDETRGSLVLPSMRAGDMLAMDMQNSYLTRFHSSDVRLWMPLTYMKEWVDENSTPTSSLLLEIDLRANFRRDWMDFIGYTNTRGGKNYVAPDIRLRAEGSPHGMKHKINFQYRFCMDEINPFNMLPVILTSDPLNIRTGNPDLKTGFFHKVNLNYYTPVWIWGFFKAHAVIEYTFHQRQTAMGYAYDRATGVRTYRPVNVNGNYEGSYYFAPTFALNRKKTLKLEEILNLRPQRSVDMVSYDEFTSSQRSVVNTLNLFNSTSLSYSVKKFMVGLSYKLSKRWVRSGIEDFTPFNITRHTYGVRGRVKLPAGFEINTDLNMFSTRGYSYPEMNTNQLVWNARITKSLLKGRMLLSVDGYDMLGQVKNISYTVNEQGRTERWVNNIPSYFMFSIRWDFSKNPK